MFLLTSDREAGAAVTVHADPTLGELAGQAATHGPAAMTAAGG